MFIVLASILCFIAMYIFVCKICDVARKRGVANAFANESGRSRVVLFAERCDKTLKRLTTKLLELDIVSRYVANLQILCGYYDFKISGRALFSSILAVAFFASLVALVVLRSPVLGFSVFVVSLMAAYFFAGNKIDKIASELREQIPEALRSMAACSRSGLSLPQTLETASAECTGQLAKIFTSVSSKMRLGYSASDSLTTMKSQSSLRELKFIAVALDVQHTTGGSIAPILESTRQFVNSEIELARALRVKTSQAKLSATIVTIMPFLLLALFSFISPDFLSPLFTTPIGIAVFLVAMTMQFAGVVLIRRMLKGCGEES